MVKKDRELSTGEPDPKTKVEKAFADIKAEMEKKIRRELGPKLVKEFVESIEHAIETMPRLWEVRARVDEEVQGIVKRFASSLDERIRVAADQAVSGKIEPMWGDFINKKIEAKLNDPALVISITKKVKELL